MLHWLRAATAEIVYLYPRFFHWPEEVSALEVEPPPARVRPHHHVLYSSLSWAIGSILLDLGKRQLDISLRNKMLVTKTNSLTLLY